jgi:hypothetical protein
MPKVLIDIRDQILCKYFAETLIIKARLRQASSELIHWLIDWVFCHHLRTQSAKPAPFSKAKAKFLPD